MIGASDTRQGSGPLLGVFVLLFAMGSIQIGAGFAKGLFPYVGTTGATTLRLFFATLILWAVFRPWRYRLSRAQLGPVVLYGLSMGTMNLLVYMAIARIPLGITVALEFTGPLTVAVLSTRSVAGFLWAALAAAGVVLLLPVSEFSTPLDPLGVLMALGAGAAWAFYIIFGQKAGGRVPEGAAITLGMTTAALLALPFGIAEAGSDLFQWAVVPIALAVALLSSALPYTLEMKALKVLPTSTFGVLMSGEPAMAALVGLLLLGEQLSLTQWLAITCIIAASIGATLAARKPPIKPAPTV